MANSLAYFLKYFKNYAKTEMKLKNNDETSLKLDDC